MADDTKPWQRRRSQARHPSNQRGVKLKGEKVKDLVGQKLPEPDPEVLFFGQLEGVGNYLWRDQEHTVPADLNPWGAAVMELPPRGRRIHGAAALQHHD